MPMTKIVANIVGEMRNSQAPSPLSLAIESLEKLTLLDSDEDKLFSESALKCQEKEDVNQVANRIACLETRHAEILRLLTVLQEFASKNSCSVDLQYQAQPLVTPDEQFIAAYNKIC